MPRTVDVNFPEHELKEVEVLSEVLGRSFSSTLIKMVKIGIEASKAMSLEDINGPKESPWGNHDSLS
ncbi:MAG: hypothetical protein V7765_21125 [Oleispira sp.]